MVVKFNHLLPAMPELGMGLPNAYDPEDGTLLCQQFCAALSQGLDVLLDFSGVKTLRS